MSTAQAPDGDNSLDQALAIAACGLRVLPIKPGQKRPPMTSWQHAASVDPKTITNWYRGLYKDCGVGIAMGLQPDGRIVFALDVDEHDPAQSGHDTLDQLEQIHGKLPDTVTSITGAGGAHLIYLSPVPVSNGAAGQVGPGLDVRGQGGQIVVAPTIHPNGTAYMWEDGSEPWECEIAEAPPWLLELVVPPTLTQNYANPAPTYVRAIAESDSPADTLRQGWDWAAELAARGWQQDQRHPENWTRPGKDPREGSSAVLHGDDGPFVVFTTDASVTPMWRAGKIGNGCVSLSPLAFVAAYDHGGDLSAATRALRHAQGPSVVDLGALVAPTASDDAEVAVEATADDEWHPTDIVTIARQIADGTRSREVPTLLEVQDGLGLFYRGRVHSIFGPPGGGKTWIALAALAERLIAGAPALFIDWEDTVDGTAARLLDLGVPVDALSLLDYISPSTALAMGILKLFELAHGRAWELVVIDSAGEAMAAAGIDPNADGQVATWMALAKSLTTVASHPAVLMLDHVPKNSEQPATFAIGSQRKLAAISGASYRCDTITEPAIAKPGKLKLVVAKDRLGNRAKGSTAAEAHFEPQDNVGALRIHFRISDAQAAHDRGERFRPTVLMERVSRWLELNPGASTNQIQDSVSGKRDGVYLALEVLVDEAWVEVADGARNARLFTSVRPYRDDLNLVDNSTSAPPPDLPPTSPGERTRPTYAPPPTSPNGGRSKGEVTGQEHNLTSPSVDNSQPREGLFDDDD